MGPVVCGSSAEASNLHNISNFVGIAEKHASRGLASELQVQCQHCSVCLLEKLIMTDPVKSLVRLAFAQCDENRFERTKHFDVLCVHGARGQGMNNS